MSNIVKRHIKKITTFSVLASVLSACVPMSAQVTPLQLRVMQTRKFAKTPNEVEKAIITNCQDMGGTATMGLSSPYHGQNQGMCRLTMGTNDRNPIALPSLTDSFAKLGSTSQTVRRIDYEITFTPAQAPKGPSVSVKDGKVQMIQQTTNAAAPTETTVRMRMYAAGEGQITDPKTYADAFKTLGDSLFIQAIEINPATQQ